MAYGYGGPWDRLEEALAEWQAKRAAADAEREGDASDEEGGEGVGNAGGRHWGGFKAAPGSGERGADASEAQDGADGRTGRRKGGGGAEEEESERGQEDLREHVEGLSRGAARLRR